MFSSVKSAGELIPVGDDGVVLVDGRTTVSYYNESVFGLWGTLTARLEPRGRCGRHYWYGYGTVNGRTKKRYIGVKLTVPKLHAAWLGIYCGSGSRSGRRGRRGGVGRG